jgi:hypothetical protein
MPGEATLRRALACVDGDELDIAVSAWITHHIGSGDAGVQGWAAVALDGKTLRGTVGPTGGAGVHLLSALTHQTGTVAGQRLVPIGSSSEIAEFEPLLEGIDLAGLVVTADALHTTRDHATYLRRPGAHSVFIVKKNQISGTVGSNNALSKSSPLPPTSTSPLPHRSKSPATAPTAPPAPARHTPGSGSPTSPQVRPPQPRSRAFSAATGRPRTSCTGSVTSPTAKTLPRPHRRRTPHHGHPAQPRHQRPTTRRLDQHRPSTAPHDPRHHTTTHTARNPPTTSTNRL